MPLRTWPAHRLLLNYKASIRMYGISFKTYVKIDCFNYFSIKK